MKSLHIATAIVCALLSGQAAAGCSAGQGWQKMKASGNPQITGLSGKTVCVPGGAGGWAAQEYHAGSTTGGELLDYKGGTDPKNRTEKVGNWSITGDQITYDYGQGSLYTYDVFTDGTNYSFCKGGAEIARATIRTGSAAVSCQ